MGRPIIGITGELDAARWGDWLREAAISPVSYIRAVERVRGRAGGRAAGAAAVGGRLHRDPRRPGVHRRPGHGPGLYDQERRRRDRRARPAAGTGSSSR